MTQGSKVAYFDFETNTIEIGTVESIYIHKDATNFVKYVFEDESYLEATDYHPIYTRDGWKSLTNIKNYETPKVGDEVKTKDEWKKIEKIETWQGLEDCYDFKVVSSDGKTVNNYFANNTLVQSSFAIFKQLNN